MRVTILRDLEFPLDTPVNYYIIHDYKVMIDAGIEPPSEGYDFVYVTHWHWDHVMGLGSIEGKTVCISPVTLDLLQKQRYSERFREVLRAGGVTLTSLELAFVNEMDKRYKFAINGLNKNNIVNVYECPHVETGEIRVLDCPGHSIDHICYIIDNYIFTGDTILPNKRTTIIDFKSHRNSIISILSEYWKLLYPGHGDALNRDAAREIASQYVVSRCSRTYKIIAEIHRMGGEASLKELLRRIYGLEPSLSSFVALRTLIGYVTELETDGIVVVNRGESPWRVKLV